MGGAKLATGPAHVHPAGTGVPVPTNPAMLPTPAHVPYTLLPVQNSITLSEGSAEPV